jgi:O-glycosyl hydrolase
METFQRILNACGVEPRVSLSRAEEPDVAQIRERLAWTPKQRLDYLVDMVAFENRARRAKRVPGV